MIFLTLQIKYTTLLSKKVYVLDLLGYLTTQLTISPSIGSLN